MIGVDAFLIWLWQKSLFFNEIHMGSKAPSSYFIFGPAHQVYKVGLLFLLEKKLLPGG